MHGNDSDSGLGSQSSSSYYQSLLWDSEEPTSDFEETLADMLRKGDMINVLKFRLPVRRLDHIFI